MTDLVRIYDTRQRRYYLVGEDLVYTDGNGDALIRRSQRADAGLHTIAELRAALEFFNRHFLAPYPGLRTGDGRFVSYGRLNAREAARFEAGEAIRGRRTALEEHLDFFDHGTRDGMISPGENFAAWRALGFGIFGAALKTVLSSLVFGRLADGFAIAIEHIGAKRPTRATRIYDGRGALDAQRLAHFLAAFDEAASRAGSAAIDQKEALRIIEGSADLGIVSHSQFQSLFAVCERLNHGKTITRAQFAGLFDGSLLMLAASYPRRDGRRRWTG